MKYTNFRIKTTLGEIVKFDDSPDVSRGIIKIDDFELRLKEVKNVELERSTGTVIIDLVDGPSEEQGEDRVSALSRMCMLDW